MPCGLELAVNGSWPLFGLGVGKQRSILSPKKYSGMSPENGHVSSGISSPVARVRVVNMALWNVANELHLPPQKHGISVAKGETEGARKAIIPTQCLLSIN